MIRIAIALLTAALSVASARRAEAQSWVDLGGSGTAGGVSATPGVDSWGATVAVDGSGRPVVAWSEYISSTGDYEVHLRRWTGEAWAPLGGSASGGGVSATAATDSLDPSLALDASGNPVIAWTALDPVSDTGEIHLKRWNGSSWTQLGFSAAGGGISGSPGADSRSPSLSLDGDGNPVVAWHEVVDGQGEIYVKRWNGTSWVALGSSAEEGGVSATASPSLFPSMSLDSFGRPWLAWHELVGTTFEVYLKRWTGLGWVSVAGSASGGGVSATPYAHSGYCSLAVGPDGLPVVAWQEEVAGIPKTYLKRLTGSTWVELGPSASGNGISGTTAMSGAPSLDLDASGLPVVAWQELTGSDSDVRLKRWTGSTWEALGGSSDPGGIGGSPNSTRPSLALDAQGSPAVAWTEEEVAYIGEVRLRQWLPAPAAPPVPTPDPGPVLPPVKPPDDEPGPVCGGSAGGAWSAWLLAAISLAASQGRRKA